MNANELDKGTAVFEAEGRLLQELGERLVASPEVALVELIKNAYDADAPSCDVSVSEENTTLEIRDTGSGMTLDQFQQRWMRIATGHKLDEPMSPRYGRKRTGQKGIGRFAVRFLGGVLQLESVAEDPKRHTRTRLVADFDWETLDAAVDLRSAPIPYTLWRATAAETTGTTLRIRALRHLPDFLASKTFRTEVLRIISPLESLERGRFGKVRRKASEVDPGFRVTLPDQDDGDPGIDLAEKILERAWARLTIDVRGENVKFSVTIDNPKEPVELLFKKKTRIKNGLLADIRYFPRRAGVFQKVGVDGRRAWTWVRENCGIAVVDHGFRMRPYGFENDDWLLLDFDSAHNQRDWRSEISKETFPIAKEVRARPGENPALNLPSNFQLVGAVFVESASDNPNDLTPAMDREGFLLNEANRELVDLVRAGVEFLALVDKRELDRRQEKAAREAAKHARADFKAAIDSIRKSPTLTRGDKARLVEHYATLSTKLDEVEEYGRDARRKLELMGLLGVVAGFMTHEAARILDGLERSIGRLRVLAARDRSLGDALRTVEEGYAAFQGHVDYTSLFIDAVHRGDSRGFKAAAQVRRVIEKFGGFASERGLHVENEVGPEVVVPPMPVAAYSGVLLNLYTNALKALLAAEERRPAPQIVFRGWNQNGRHVLEVLDKGVGIPPELKQRIFDPLFTTTSNIGNPLGSGMGLGLSLVKEVVSHTGGRIILVDAPSGFSTCFRAEFGGVKG